MDTQEVKTSILSNYGKISKKSVSQDYFLYTCLEEQRTLNAVFKKNLGLIHSFRWPKLVDSEKKVTTTQDSFENLSKELRALVTWYSEEYQELKQELKELEQQDRTVRPFMLMIFDIQELMKKLTGSSLPKIADKDTERAPVWDEIKKIFEDVVPARSQLAQSYLHWLYKDISEEPLDIKAPPVGRYFKIINKAVKAGRAKNKI